MSKLCKFIEKIRIWAGFSPRLNSIEHIITYQRSSLEFFLNLHKPSVNASSKIGDAVAFELPKKYTPQKENQDAIS